MPALDARPLVEGVLVAAGGDGRPRLLQSRCRACSAIAFPVRRRCAACSSEDLVVEDAPATGTVYSWTTAPGSNPPRVVAMVRLDNGLMAQGAVAATPDAMTIDARARLILTPAGEADDGSALVSYAFELEQGEPS